MNMVMALAITSGNWFVVPHARIRDRPCLRRGRRCLLSWSALPGISAGAGALELAGTLVRFGPSVSLYFKNRVTASCWVARRRGAAMTGATREADRAETARTNDRTADETSAPISIRG